MHTYFNVYSRRTGLRLSLVQYGKRVGHAFGGNLYFHTPGSWLFILGFSRLELGFGREAGRD